MKPWRLKARFAAKTGPKEYISGDVRIHPRWGDEVFNRPIETLDFSLPTGHRIRLTGYEQYNFFVECSKPLCCGPARIEAFFLAGKSGRIVDIWRIGNGRVVRDKRPWGAEWGGASTRGWKPGESGRRASTDIIGDRVS